MADDAQKPDQNLPPGLTPLTPATPSTPIVSSAGADQSIPVPSEPPSFQPTSPPVSPSPISGVKQDSSLSDLAKSLHETPATPMVPSEPSAIPPPSISEELPEKKSGGKTSAIVGALFLLLIIPIVGYYVSQRGDVTRTLQRAWTGAYPTPEPRDTPEVLPCCKPGVFRPLECRQCDFPSITISPTISVTVTPTETPIITATVTPTQTPTPTSPPPEPGKCDASCGSDGNCQSGLICASVEGVKRCRNPECTSEFTCGCPKVVIVTATPRPPVVVVTKVVEQVVVTATPTPIPVPKTPVSGTPTVLGAATVAGGILLLLIGLIL